MTNEINTGGQTFRVGDKIIYTTLKGAVESGKIEAIFHNPPAIKIRFDSNNTVFAINAGGFPRLKKASGEEPEEPVNIPANTPQPNNNPIYNPPAQNYNQKSTPTQSGLSWNPSPSTKTPSNVATAAAWLLFLAIIVHVIDAFVFNFQRDPAVLGIRLLMYFVLFLFASLFVEKDFLRTFKTHGKVLAIPTFLIPLVAELLALIRVPELLVNNMAFVFYFVPVYVLYLLFFSGIDFTDGQGKISFIAKVAKGYFILLLVVGIGLIYINFIAGAIAGSEMLGRETITFSPKDALEGGKIIITSIGDGIQKIVDAGKKGYTRLYNDSLGAYYTGQVEENKDVTGVFIQELNTMGTYFEGQDVELFAVIKARSFVDEINMTTGCVAQDLRNKTNIIVGRTDPKEITGLYRDDYRGVKCVFENENQLKRGNYEIIFSAEFNFETWAYITLTFMDRDFLSSLYLQQVDVYSRYNIRPRIRTIYTNGPVMLGMNDNMEMPLPLSTKDNSKNNLYIGMTLDDKVQGMAMRGELLNVDSFEFRVPKEFQVTTCSIPGAGKRNEIKEDNITGYNIHSFDLTPTPGKYTTVACSVEISEANARKLLSDPIGKQDVTIAGAVTYDYKLIRRTTIDVKQGY